jgi:hypothetical protein
VSIDWCRFRSVAPEPDLCVWWSTLFFFSSLGRSGPGRVLYSLGVVFMAVGALCSDHLTALRWCGGGRGHAWSSPRARPVPGGATPARLLLPPPARCPGLHCTTTENQRLRRLESVSGGGRTRGQIQYFQLGSSADTVQVSDLRPKETSDKLRRLRRGRDNQSKIITGHSLACCGARRPASQGCQGVTSETVNKPRPDPVRPTSPPPPW